jgi:hypothetical protein
MAGGLCASLAGLRPRATLKDEEATLKDEEATLKDEGQEATLKDEEAGGDA